MHTMRKEGLHSQDLSRLSAGRKRFIFMTSLREWIAECRGSRILGKERNVAKGHSQYDRPNPEGHGT